MTTMSNAHDQEPSKHFKPHDGLFPEHTKLVQLPSIIIQNSVENLPTYQYHTMVRQSRTLKLV